MDGLGGAWEKVQSADWAAVARSARSLGRRLFYVVSTAQWLDLLMSMGLKDDGSIDDAKEWAGESAVRDEQLGIVRGRLYGCRAHDLLDILDGSRAARARSLLRMLAEKYERGTAASEMLLGNRRYASLDRDCDVRTMVASAHVSEPRYGPIEVWDTRRVVAMTAAFYETDVPVDLSLWDTSSVTNMNYMFAESKSQLVGLERWNTSRVTSMLGMFYGTEFAGDIGSWDTHAVVRRREKETRFSVGS
jgi:hypothetical protein